jgi:hypothetical protein
MKAHRPSPPMRQIEVACRPEPHPPLEGPTARRALRTGVRNTRTARTLLGRGLALGLREHSDYAALAVRRFAEQNDVSSINLT